LLSAGDTWITLAIAGKVDSVAARPPEKPQRANRARKGIPRKSAAEPHELRPEALSSDHATVRGRVCGRRPLCDEGTG